jgi:hypothetical protein
LAQGTKLAAGEIQLIRQSRLQMKFVESGFRG